MLLTQIEKLQTWGLKGVVNYVFAHLRNTMRSKFFRKNAQQNPLLPQKGITIIAPFGDQNSFSKTHQDLIKSLADNDIPFQTFNLSANDNSADDDIKKLLTPTDEFKVLKYSHIIGLPSDEHFFSSKGISTYQLCFWEFESGLIKHNHRLTKLSGIIAMSDFNESFFKNELPKSVKIRNILYPFRIPDFPIENRNTVRERYNCSVDDFIVFYNFSVRSSYYRKNPDGCLRAFAEAFRDTPNAKLVFKISGNKDNPGKIELLTALAHDLGVSDRLIIISNFLSTPEIYSLTASCDVYLSLHRGEGFGLGIAEAMSLGVPPVLTAYSAPLQFCNENNSILIPYTMRKVEPFEVDNKSYRFVEEWAEADIYTAAQALRQLFYNPELRKRIGEMARTTILELFSSKKFKESILRFINN